MTSRPQHLWIGKRQPLSKRSTRTLVLISLVPALGVLALVLLVSWKWTQPLGRVRFTNSCATPVIVDNLLDAMVVEPDESLEIQTRGEGDSVEVWIYPVPRLQNRNGTAMQLNDKFNLSGTACP